MQPTVLLTRSALNQLTGLQVSTCVRVSFLSFCVASPVSITGSLTVQGQWMIVPLVFLLSPYLRLHREQSCREAPWITVHSGSPVSCPVLSPDPSPYQLCTHSSRDSHVDTLSTGPVRTPVTKAYLHCVRGIRGYIHTPTHR